MKLRSHVHWRKHQWTLSNGEREEELLLMQRNVENARAALIATYSEVEQ